jgi:hypothetical protein
MDRCCHRSRSLGRHGRDKSGELPAHQFCGDRGTGEQRISRDHSLTVPRSSLQEDTGGDTDEIECKVRIHAQGLPDDFTPDVFTDQETLF